ncbi:protein ALTERED XYLOGLUCAN 4-like [Citrus sinensis]|uniref:xyloglucan O-acetyltransferase 4-like n=1 Tax=Citrus sinensis TaxID=2711 RepID=UPI00218CC3B3|nr:xyloglucan O-acetyltransferase 4-like [Citrus sinensis]KAH9742019.1 protein ALTERED XYLOGLUCAN 4-like [Citrus sinensis]
MKSSSSSSLSQDKFYINAHGGMGRLGSFLFYSLALTTVFSFFLLFSPSSVKILPKSSVHYDQGREKIDVEECDLFKGRWVPDFRGSQYTNWSCPTIPVSKNCFRHGRKDTDFLNWRWKPHNCDLPRFDAKQFLAFVRGKKLAFIGDSVARNHMESLLCLLSQEEVPIDAYKDSEDRHRIWYFADHDFTLSILWSKFLVLGEERVINGSSSGIYDLYLDKVDDRWASDLPYVDYAIISTAHWFFRPIHVHDGGKVIGCVFCNEPNVRPMDPLDAIGLAFRAILRYINQCKQCNKRKMLALFRTFSPAHFEHGAWDTGGSCNRTSPFSEKDIDYLGDFRWKLRNVQEREIERAREEAADGNKMFGVLDVTMAMLMRPDGHPGAFWDNKYMKGYNDCVHWCLPGPIDVWNDLLIQVLTKVGAGG